MRRRLYSEDVDLAQSPRYSSLADFLRPSEADVAEVGMCPEPVEDVVEGGREDVAEVEDVVEGVREDVAEVGMCPEPVEDVVEGVREDVAEVEDVVEGVGEDVAEVEDVVEGVREDVAEVGMCPEPVEDVVEGVREDVAEVEDVVEGVREEMADSGRPDLPDAPTGAEEFQRYLVEEEESFTEYFESGAIKSRRKTIKRYKLI